MIGGRLDARGLALLAGRVDDADYRRRAELHRPSAATIRAEALRLLASGLQPRDVAQALRVAESQVLEWRKEPA